MHIREIRDPHLFQRFCQQLLIAEFADAQEVDDLRGDRGIDLFVPSAQTLYAIYCPRKDSTEKKTMREKINDDVDKAARLPKTDYDIRHFAFVTPAPLDEKLRLHLVEYGRQKGFQTVSAHSEKYLVALLAKHPNLCSHFPELAVPDLARKLDAIVAEIKKSSAATEDTEIDVEACLEKYRSYFEQRAVAAFRGADDAAAEYNEPDEFFNRLFIIPSIVAGEVQILPTENQQGALEKSTDTQQRQGKNAPTNANVWLSPEQIITSGTHSLVRAAPGAGKTSLLLFLAWRVLRGGTQRLPVFVNLKLLRKNDLNDLTGGLGEVLFRHALANDGALDFTPDEIRALQKRFMDELRAGNVVGFLDGLDEIGSEKEFALVTNLIEEFARGDFRANALVVSARPYVLAGARLSGLRELRILPFDERQIYRFINSRFGAESEIGSIKLLLNQHPRLLELARTPLLLAMMTDFVRRSDSLPPDDAERAIFSRLGLYRQLTTDLVRKIDRTKRVKRFDFQTDDPHGSMKLHFLRFLAFESLFGGVAPEKQKSGSRSRAVRNRFLLTDEFLADRASAFTQVANLRENSFALADDVKLTPLLAEVKDGTWAFAHSTFQEFLAAEWLKNLPEERDQLIELAYFNPNLVEREVLPMTLGLLDDAEPLFQKIKKLPESAALANVRLRARAVGYGARVGNNEIRELFAVLLAAVELEKPVESGFLEILAPALTVDDSDLSSFFVQNLMKTAVAADGGEVETRAIRAIKLLGTADSLLVAADKVLGGDTRFMSADAIDIVGAFGDREDIEPLLIRLHSNGDLYLGERAALALGRLAARNEIYREEIARHLLRRINELEDDSFEARTIGKALGGVIGELEMEEIARRLDDAKTRNKPALIVALGASRNEAAEAVLKHLAERESLGFYAVDALGYLGRESAAEFLIELLRRDKRSTASRAALALGRLKSAESVPVLIESLESQRDDVREYAAFSLGEIGDRRAALPLLERLEKERVEYAQAATLVALGKLSVPAARRFVAEFLLKENASLRRAAVETAGLLGDADALLARLNFLQTDILMIRRELAITSGTIGTRQAVAPLLALINDPDPEVRAEAARGLTAINFAELSEGITGALAATDHSARKTALEFVCYYRRDQELLDCLLKLAQKDEHPAIRKAAFAAAAQCQDQIKDSDSNGTESYYLRLKLLKLDFDKDFYLKITL